MKHWESGDGLAAPAPSILLVDDTAENLRLLAGMLATHGFDTRPVTSGAEALEAVAHEAPDLILLDVTMPGMNGFEVCAQLKATPASREIPVIFLTALTGVQDKLDGFIAGGVDFITKPFHLEEVIARGEITGDAGEDVDSAIKAAQEVTQMSNTLLDVSRLEEGKMPLSLALGDLVPIAQESAEMLGALDSSRTITIESVGPVTAMCDRSLIRRVIDNLVSNAVKHTPSGGRVVIELSAGPGGTRVAVSDNGAGVPEELRGRLFEKFAGVHTQTRKAVHSAGLGLAFCKLAVEAHGGTIGVEAATPRGSIFAFELPA